MSDELMKNKLDDEEREVLKAFEQGETVSVPNVEQAIADAGEAARNTYAKNRRDPTSRYGAGLHACECQSPRGGLVAAKFAL